MAMAWRKLWQGKKWRWAANRPPFQEDLRSESVLLISVVEAFFTQLRCLQPLKFSGLFFEKELRMEV